ncbi:MAG: hypothetical protein ACLGH0_07275, partial [Thermoanaerobaculia bacterium]
AETAAPEEVPNSYMTRERFMVMLQQYPPDLGYVLGLDPSLLLNETFVAGYPELQKFLNDHPEVRRNPRFYTSQYEMRRSGPFGDFVEGLAIFSTIAFIAFVLSWILRTIIEQRRWSQLSRTQVEVHNKILDRFGSTAELIEYMKTPSGSKFLESAPIQVREEQPVQNAPVARILWSVQLGVVVMAGGIGLLIVSSRFDRETAHGLFAFGMIALSIGIGFIASALVSLFLSRRLGIWQGPRENSVDESGLVR